MMTDEYEDCWDCRGTGIGNPHTESPCYTCNGRGCVIPNDTEREIDDTFDDYDNPADDFAYDPPCLRDPD